MLCYQELVVEPSPSPEPVVESSPSSEPVDERRTSIKEEPIPESDSHHSDMAGARDEGMFLYLAQSTTISRITDCGQSFDLIRLSQFCGARVS